jgi:hypothetical protein
MRAGRRNSMEGLVGSIYKKRDTYYIRFKDQRGKWVSRAAAANKKDAERILKDVERGVRRLGSTAPVSDQPSAEGSRLRDHTAEWLKRRRNRGLRNVDNDKGHLDNHILPALGDMAGERDPPASCGRVHLGAAPDKAGAADGPQDLRDAAQVVLRPRPRRGAPLQSVRADQQRSSEEPRQRPHMARQGGLHARRTRALDQLGRDPT